MKDFAYSQKINHKFLGIRDFIVKASQLEFMEEPNYDCFNQLLLDMMKPYYSFLGNKLTDSIATQKAEILDNECKSFISQFYQKIIQETAHHMIALKARELKEYYV